MQLLRAQLEKYASPRAGWRQELSPGSDLDVKNESGEWQRATVVDAPRCSKRVLVQCHDAEEWIMRASARLAPFGSFTSVLETPPKSASHQDMEHSPEAHANRYAQILSSWRWSTSLCTHPQRRVEKNSYRSSGTRMIPLCLTFARLLRTETNQECPFPVLMTGGAWDD